MLWLLLAEFLLGMSVNLFVGIPTGHPGAGSASYFLGLVQGLGWALTHGTLLLVLHVALGLLLVVGSITLVFAILARRPRVAVAPAVTGWIGVTGAAFNGGSFINYGHDFSSMLMATGFAIAAASYVLALAALLRAGRSR
jgi:hypothetical protein